MMDPDIFLLHVVPPGKPKPQNLLIVQVSPTFNRLNPPEHSAEPSQSQDPEYSVAVTCQNPNPNPSIVDRKVGNWLDNLIDLIWQKRTKENPKLYNATKFRLHSITSSEDTDKVLLCLGVTDYREYLGTNWANNITELHTLGLSLHESTQAFLSDALGVGAFLLTDDNCVVFLRRSEFCAEAPCLWDIPGGHAEPKEIVGDIPLDCINVYEMNEDLVLAEIFQSIIREVTDEVNIAPSNLDEPLYLGTVRNKTSGGRPSSEFLIRCHLTSQEVKQLYEKGSQSEADESTNIKTIPLDELNQMANEDDRRKSDLWKNLAPSAKGCLILYWMSHNIIS